MFQCRAAGEHQHDDGRHQVLSHECCGSDGDSGQQIGAEVSGGHTSGQLDDEGNASAGQRDDERKICYGKGRSEEISKRKM